jgi:hypothetical protein
MRPAADPASFVSRPGFPLFRLSLPFRRCAAPPLRPPALPLMRIDLMRARYRLPRARSCIRRRRLRAACISRARAWAAARRRPCHVVLWMSLRVFLSCLHIPFMSLSFDFFTCMPCSPVIFELVFSVSYKAAQHEANSGHHQCAYATQTRALHYQTSVTRRTPLKIEI